MFEFQDFDPNNPTPIYKPSEVLDDLHSHHRFRRDSQNGILARQLVLATLRELFRHEHTATKWVDDGLIDISTGINAGANEYSYQEVESVGEAEFVADDATDIPQATIQGQNNIHEIKTMAIGISYSRQDMRAASMQGLYDVVTEKVMAAREGHNRRMNRAIRVGVPGTSLEGVVNRQGIIVANAINGNWQAATFQQIEEDVNAAINAIINQSDGVEVPNTVLFDVATWSLLNTKPRGPGDNTLTIMDFLRRAHPEITRWDWEPGLKGVSATGGASMLVYRNDSSRLRAQAPLIMAPTPPEVRGFSFMLNFETRYGGVMCPRPRSILRLDGI